MFEGASTIDIARFYSSLATPIALALIGFWLNRRLKSIDNAQWQNRKIVEKRLELYDQIAPDLNKTYCFLMWVGYWKDVSPADMVESKRNLDKTVNVYRHLLSPRFYDIYNEYIHLAFSTYTGTGKDALIRSRIASSDGNRMNDTNFQWDDDYISLFDSEDVPDKKQIKTKYDQTLEALRNCIGLSSTT